MMMLFSTNGYSMFDRKNFAQGEHQTLRFDNDFTYPLDANLGTEYTAIHQLTNSYIDNAYNGTGKLERIPLYRLILDNTFLVYYMSGIDENMNAIWTRLTNMNGVIDDLQSSGQEMVVCKLKRYSDSKIRLGQGSESDREILSKYFYLLV